MLTVMGIDQSLTSTGVCIVTEFLDPESVWVHDILHTCTIPTSKTDEPSWLIDTATRAEIIVTKLNELIGEYRPDVVVFEALSLGSTGSATRTLPVLMGYILALLDAEKIYTVPPSTLKKFATGKGNAKKEAMYGALTEEHTAMFSIANTYLKTKGRYDVVDAYWLTQYMLGTLYAKD